MTASSGTRTAGRSSGQILQVVPSRKVSTAAPVAIARPASFGSGVTLRVTRTASKKVKARLPGEFSGPAVELTLVVHNGSSRAVALDNFVMTVVDAHSRPLPQLTTTPARPFRGRVAAGRSRTAVYVYTVPVANRRHVTVSASYSAAAPTVLFVGNV